MTRRQLLAVLAFLEDEPLSDERLELEARVIALLALAPEPVPPSKRPS